ncbi:di-trans,poly-cis-decaprenylcistransferase [Microlunatus elymi]|uniref:Isoprenyl transferase n=1 Tax=Microlunatus elymi TaxID=2596828 RepID=A0A516Q1C1_9ACTN|nr:polyprenyl diphosphate synthase [Microlunatus elymi]QDP97182.1 di-trans,poly-cis-decaprenylcistransferase [Microlunatus elymi]
MVLRLRRTVEWLYAYRLRRHLAAQSWLPDHIGVIMDGNRRWARRAGFDNPSIGHQYGAEHLEDLLHWCQRLDINHVTVFVCSTENLDRRAAGEVSFLMNVIETTISRILTRPGRSWRVHMAGNPDVLPDSTATSLKELCNRTDAIHTGRHLTLAVGYGGRQEIVDAFIAYLDEHTATTETLDDLAHTFEATDIDRHLYQPGLPLPDIIIRTSGEQRSSNFLIWQGSHADYYFCDAYWPAFREVDLLRAVRDYTRRRRGRS